MKLKLMMILAAMAAVFAASAETYKLTAAGSNKNAAWTDAQYWADSSGQTGTPGGTLDPEGEYLIDQAYTLAVPANAVPFSGGVITISNAKAFLVLMPGETTVPGGIAFGRGYIQAMGSATLNADVSVGHWNRDNHFTGPNGSGYSLTLNGDLSCNYTGNNPGDYYRQWHLFQPYANGQLFYVNLNGDILDDANICFAGRADVSDDTGATKSGIIVTMGSASQIGTLMVSLSARIKAKAESYITSSKK